jgi:hypothetical protein
MLYWIVAVKTKPRDVFENGNLETIEENDDTYHDIEPFNVTVEDTHQEVADNLPWLRDDVDETVCATNNFDV